MKPFFKILLIVSTLMFANNLFANNELVNNEPKIKFVQVYPNPATTNINFDVAILDKGLTVTIYNFIGKKVEEIKLANGKTNINVENYFRGLYIYQLRNKQGQLIESGRFQVAK